jgi:hypothetical protein
VGLLIVGLIFVTLLVHQFIDFSDMIFLMFKVCLPDALMREAVYILIDSNTGNSMLLEVFPRLELVIITRVGILLGQLRPKEPIFIQVCLLIVVTYLINR